MKKFDPFVLSVFSLIFFVPIVASCQSLSQAKNLSQNNITDLYPTPQQSIIDSMVAGNQIVIIDDDELLGLSVVPNPFVTETQINMSVNVDMQVVLSLYDILGNFITTIYSGDLTAGSHALSFDGSQLNSGSYYLVLQGPTKSTSTIIIKD